MSNQPANAPAAPSEEDAGFAPASTGTAAPRQADLATSARLQMEAVGGDKEATFEAGRDILKEGEPTLMEKAKQAANDAKKLAGMS